MKSIRRSIIMVFLAALLAPYDSLGQCEDWPLIDASPFTFMDATYLDVTTATDYDSVLIAVGSFQQDTLFIGSELVANAYPSTDNILIAQYDLATRQYINARTINAMGDERVTHIIPVNIAISGYAEFLIAGTLAGKKFNDLTPTQSIDFFIGTFERGSEGINVLTSNGAGNERITDVFVDAEGSIYFCGTYETGELIFEGDTISSTGFGEEVFVAKLNTQGNLQWLVNSTGTGGPFGGDVPVAIVADTNGNVFIAGYYNSPDFTLDNITLTRDAFARDMFIAGFDPSGNLTWATGSGGPGEDFISDMAVGMNGNLLVTGSFQSTSTSLGGLSIPNLGDMGTTTMYLCEIDTDGNAVWCETYGGGTGSTMSPGELEVDDEGTIFISGSFQSSGNAARIPFGTDTLATASNVSDAFLVALSADGEALWARSISGNMGESFSGIHASAFDDKLYVSGYHTGEFLTIGESVYDDNNRLFIAEVNKSKVRIQISEQAICKGEVLEIGGISRTESGVYLDTLRSEAGCDSIIVETHLEVLEIQTTIDRDLCEGDSILAGGMYRFGAGSYYDTLVSLIHGCDSIVETQVSLVEIDKGIAELENTLFASQTGAVYQWIDCSDMQPIPGETNVSFRPDPNGSYAVEVTLDGCTVISDCFDFQLLQTNGLLRTKIYPNPAGERLTLHFKNRFGHLTATYFDMMGQELGKYAGHNSDRLNLDINHLNPGIYVLIVDMDGRSFTTKFLKD